jgi:hypothetical protein
MFSSAIANRVLNLNAENLIESVVQDESNPVIATARLNPKMIVIIKVWPQEVVSAFEIVLSARSVEPTSEALEETKFESTVTPP